jgi:tetratricopeptide (TPR) repeat protein
MPLALDLMGKLASKIGCKRLLKRLRSGVSRLRLLKQEDPVKLSWEISYQELVQQHPEAARIFRMLASFTQPVFLICEHLAGILAQEKKIVMPALSLEECRIGAEDELIRLANWSLLQEDKSIEGEKNQYFRVHPLLHEYAQSVLVEADERRDAIRNHLLYCIAFVEANPQVDLQKHERSTVEFEKSYGQLLQALIEIKKHQVIDPVDWQKDGTTAHQVILLVDALDNYWEFHNQFSEQAEWLPLAYACAGALSDPIGQADFARRLGRALGWQGKLDEAVEWMDRSEDALGGDESDKAQALRALLCIHRASIVYQKGDDEEAEKDCLRGVALVDAEKQPRIYAEGYNLLGVIQMNIGRLTSALEALEKSLSTWKQVGDQYQIFRAADNARTVLFYLGDMTNLREAEDAGLQYWEQFPNHIDLAIALTNRGLVHQIDGEYQAAIKLHKRAIEISDRLAVRRMQATTRANIADTYISLGQYDEAQAYVKQSMEIQTHYDTKESWVDAHRSLAEVALGRKLYGQAVELAESALGIAREDKDPLEEGSALRVLGRALYMNGDLERARECLEESLILLQRKGFRYESFLTLQALAKLYEAVGEAEKAQAIAEQAKSLASQMGINMQNPSSDIE